VGVDPDEVADGRKLEDTSSGCQSECRAADLCPWKGVLPSGHRNLEPFDKNNRVVRIPCVAFQWCNQSRRSTSLKATVQRSDAYFHAKPLAEKRHFLPIISAPKHTPNIMYLSMVGTYPSPVVAKRASGNREQGGSGAGGGGRVPARCRWLPRGTLFFCSALWKMSTRSKTPMMPCQIIFRS